MLSGKDIKLKILNGNIAIDPLKKDTIDNAGIRLTASEFAWEYNVGWKERTDEMQWKQIKIDRKYSADGRDRITVPPQTSAFIVTEEKVYLDVSIAGACYTRVDIAWNGVGLIATPMKPNRAERLVIRIHNETNDPQHIDVGARIALIMLHELSSEAEVPFLDNDLCEERNELIKKLGRADGKKYSAEDENIPDQLQKIKMIDGSWCPIDPENIKNLMEIGAEYKKIKKEYQRERLIDLLLIPVYFIVIILVMGLVILTILLFINKFPGTEEPVIIFGVIASLGVIISYLPGLIWLYRKLKVKLSTRNVKENKND